MRVLSENLQGAYFDLKLFGAKPVKKSTLYNENPLSLIKGSHRPPKVQFFFNIVQKAFDPPPLSFEHYVVNFSEGILTKVRKHLSRQLSTKQDHQRCISTVDKLQVL